MDWLCFTLYFVSLFLHLGVMQHNIIIKKIALIFLISRIYMSASRWFYGVHYPALSAIVSLCHVLLGLNFTPPVNPYVTLSWVNHLRVWTGGPKSLNVVRCYRVGRSPCWPLARESVLHRVYACKVEYLSYDSFYFFYWSEYIATL